MITIKINQEEVDESKRLTKVFDSVKTYEKFVCKTNYIGILGEMVFNRYLNEQHIEHYWHKFIKQGWNKPDFNINDKTIDLKTTYSDLMWFQQPKFDIYIYAQITSDDKYLHVKGWMTKQGLERAQKNNKANIVKRGSRIDYVIPPNKMLPISLLSVVFPPPQQLYNHEVLK